MGGDYYLWLGTWINEPTDTNFELARGDAPNNAYEVTINFTIPELPYKSGGYMLSLYNAKINAEGTAATAYLKVLPTLQVVPKSIIPGTELTLKGTGFPAKDEVTLFFDGTDTKMPIETNSLGSFTLPFTVNDTISGKHQFKVTVPDLYNIEASASITVGPEITVEPDTLVVGSEVIISGRGFAASSSVSIIYDDETITSSPTTDTTGNFSYTFEVPQSSKPQHTLVAQDKAGNKATYGGDTMMEDQPPLAPDPVQPRGERFGMMGSKVVKFEWSEVTDESGVTYTLEIARDLNFFPLEPGMRKTELTKTNCLISMPPGTYYWRVRAVDLAGNESQWALSPYPFRIGFISLPYLIVGILLAALILVLILRTAFRRIREYT
jgi:hypothetical protein